ncbi:MAG: YfhO family protein [Lachnospiraceae bacterium]|nr:YfhO family protein [Lachnospiraceae bacterium]
MDKIKKFAKDKWFYIAALLTPWIIALVHSALNDTWVTGNGNIAVGDLQAQIIPFAYEIWDKFHLHQSIDFTWHVVDGINFHTMTGYLVSPFTLLMLFFPRNMIPDFIQFTMLAKWSLCSLTTVYFFYKTRFNKLEENKELVSLFLGLAYALGNGIMSYIGFIQFMDVMICFPILLLLVERMVTDEKTPWKLYYIILVWCIISNAYPSFQVCIFLAMWFVFQISGDETHRLKKFIVFSASSLAAAFTNIWILRGGISAAGSRMATDGVDSRVAFVSKPLIALWEFVKQFFVLEPIATVRSYCPNIYMTVTAAFLLLLFPIIRIEKRRKACLFVIIAILAISFFEGHLNLLWHIMNIPNGVYNRFMFLFVFAALFAVLLVFNSIDAINYKVLVPCGVVALGLFAYTITGITQFGNVMEYLATPLIICFVIIVLVLFIRKSVDYKQLVYVLAVLGLAEVVISSYSSFSYYDGALCYGKNGLVNQACELLDDAELNEGERIVSLTPSPNIGMITNQNADGGFLSSINPGNRALHEKLGMSTNSNVEFGVRGASPLCNLIFNIRYVHGESEMICSDSEVVANDEYLQLYRTNRLAGLGYMVSDSIRDWDSEGKNCFQYQNDFVKKAVGGDDVFTAADGTVKFSDLYGNESKPDEEALKYGLYQYSVEEYTYDEGDARELDFTAEKDMDLYMFFHSNQNLSNYIYVDGEQKHVDARQFRQSTYHIGKVKKGQTVSIISAPSEKTVYGNDYTMRYLFADFDEAAYAKAYEKLSKNVYVIEKEEANYIKGTIEADESGIMMTSIPSGFGVYVDGQKVERELIGDTFIGVPLSKGTHEVEFRYTFASRKKGIIISAICIAVFLLICAMDVFKKYGTKKSINDNKDDE